LTDPFTVSRSKLVVHKAGAFTRSIRIKGYTVSLNHFFTLSIRVCGEERINLVQSTKRSYIFGIEDGDKTTMSDSTRYLTIP
jgi:hypothetical protein